MSSTSRSVVLGAYADLPARQLEPFARSLRATGFKGSLCVVAGLFDSEQRAALGALADDVLDVDASYSTELRRVRALLGRVRRTRRLRRIYPLLFRLAARTRAQRAAYARWSSLEYHLEGLQTLRYAHYLRYLRERAPAADLVMIADLRDVVFQRDPFEEPVDGLEVYLEDDSVRVGHDAFNTRWLRDLLGSAGAERLRGARVSCSGTVVGTREAMLAYLHAMTAEGTRRRRPMGPHDQALHNILLYGGRLPAVRAVPNGFGRVLTLGKMTAVEVDRDGRVLNADGSLPAVVHQWDRHAELVRLVESGSFERGTRPERAADG